MPTQTASGNLELGFRHGPAMLITHNCTLDKRNKRGELLTPRYHFLPVIALSEQNPDRQATIRRNELTPYEVCYLGDCGELQESFVVLHEIYALPSALFSPYLGAFEVDPEAESGQEYLGIQANDSRIGRIEDNRVELLRRKLNAYWTRKLSESPRAEAPPPAKPEQVEVVHPASGAEIPATGSAPARNLDLEGLVAALPWPVRPVASGVVDRLRSIGGR